MIGFVEGAFQRPGAVVPKVDPFVLHQFALNALLRKELADHLSGVISGTRVANHPVIKPNVAAQILQGWHNHVRLVLDNHV